MLDKNKFYDINQLPQEEGLLLFGISMNRIGNIQSSENKYQYLEALDEKIIKTDGIGLVTLYSDYLYFNSKIAAKDLKKKYLDLMISHKNGFLQNINKNPSFTKKAFSFYTFGQMILDNSDIYKKALDTVFQIYKKDDKFRAYILADVYLNQKAEEEEEEELGIAFILEEITLFYLFAKGLVKTNNEFVKNPKWTLQCYPGKPLKSEVYLFQLNPLKLSNEMNKYENHFYDLKNKVLYDYTRFDIESFDFSEIVENQIEFSYLNLDFDREKVNLRNLEIKDVEGKGKGLFAKMNFKKGDIVFHVHGEVVDYATDYTIPINKGEKIEPRISKTIAQYMNHSCHANIYPDKNGRDYVAMRDMQEGEEVVTNYAFLGSHFGEEMSIDGKSKVDFDKICKCESENCKGELRGYNDLDQVEKAEYRDFVLPFLLENKKKKFLGIF